jgi:hypothetical protein
MQPYDKDKRYFGPQGSPLNKLIPQAPPTMPILQPVFNRAAYDHDGAYEGEKKKGILGKIINFLERRKADIAFRDKMIEGIHLAGVKGTISVEQEVFAKKYAKTAYAAVRLGGWVFYKTEKDTEEDG